MALKLVRGFVLTSFYLSVLGSSGYKFVNCSSELRDDEGNHLHKMSNHDPQLQLPIRTPSQLEAAGVLDWLDRTNLVLLDVMDAIKNEFLHFLRGKSGKSLVYSNARCQLAKFQSNQLFFGKQDAQNLGSKAGQTITNRILRVFNETVKGLSCFSDALRDIVNRTVSLDSANRKDYDKLLKALQMAEASVVIRLREIENKQSYLEDAINNLVRDSERPSRYRRESDTEAQDLSGLSKLLTILRSAVNILVFLRDNLENAPDALSLVNLLILEMENLLKLVETSKTSSIGYGSIVINHGPYCNDLTIRGTLMEIFWELLNDTVSHSLVLKQEFENIASLQEAMDAVSCRASAFSRVLQIIVRRMTSTEKTVVSDALENALLQVKSLRNILQEPGDGSQATKTNN